MKFLKVILKRIVCAVVFVQALAVHAQDAVADNMLLFQRSEGGWPKHYEEKAIDYNRIYTDAEKAAIKDEHNRNDATIDNNATTKEIRYLLKKYKQLNNKIYLVAAEKGVKYLLDAQYKNGGFPQFYPDLSSYRHEITYNDEAMINALNVLYDITKKANDCEVVDAQLIPKAEKAVQRGIQCILKTQIKVKKQLTAWFAQYDEVTLQPAMARKYELVSLSGNESVGIVKFLMKQENPSPEIKNAINAAEEWLEKVKLKGYRYMDINDATMPKGRDRVIVEDSTSTIWARFYEIGTNLPFFSGRDSIKNIRLAK